MDNEQVLQQINEWKQSSWPELVPLDMQQPARLPVDQWPEVLRKYAKEAATETETPIELPAMLALGCVAAAVQRLVSVEVKPGYIEPCCLFAAVSLPPATRKSAEFSRATKPLVKWESDRREEVAEQAKAAESLLATHKERVKELRKQAAKADGGQADRLAAELAELEANPPPIPKAPRIWTSDVTTEHLATMMAQNDQAMAVMSAEGGIFETMAGRYSHNVPNIDLYLKAHAGDAARVDRGSKPPVLLDNPRLTLALTVQPDVVSSLSNKPGFKGRGLLGRVLFVLPPSSLGSRTGTTARMSGLAYLEYERTITRLVDMAHNSENGPFTIELDDDARDAWLAFSQEVEPELIEGGRFYHCTDWAGKLPGTVARIAALFHAVRYVHNLTARNVGLEDMQAAIETGRALSEHALMAYGLMGADPGVEDAKVLISWAQRHELTEFTRRQAHNHHQSRFPKADDMQPGLDVLEERGFIRRKEHEENQKGGRPAIAYEVRPGVL